MIDRDLNTPQQKQPLEVFYKRHVTVFMALSIGTIYQELSFTKYLNFTKNKEEIANVYRNVISVFK